MIKLILMAALLFVSGASMAQRVVVGKNNEAIIDNRAMPAGAITKAKKPRITDATNAAMGTNTLTNLSSLVTNETVSHYFEVAKTDSGGALAWLEAVNSCRNYTSGDGNDTWRAVTQREWQLIWILHESLKYKITDFVTLGNARYWTASESDISNEPWHAISDSRPDGQGGYLYNNGPKRIAYLMRCVRDLDPQ